MKIVVTVKLVPDTNAEKRIDPVSKRLVRTGIETVLNPFDEYAIEEALKIKESLGAETTVTVFSMAPDASKEILRKALAMGADDAVVLADSKLEGSDVWGTANAMAAALRKIGFDLVLCGVQSTDAITGEVPGLLAGALGVPGLTYVKMLDVRASGTISGQRETETGYVDVTVRTPCLVSVTKAINEPRYPGLKGIMGAKKKPLVSLSLSDLDLAAAVGEDGAKTEVLDLESPPPRAKAEVYNAANAADGARKIFDFLRERKLV